MTTATSRPGLHPERKPDREDENNRYYDGVSFASDTPIPWILGRLKLGKCDLSRMRTAGVPVLRAHDGDKVAGQVTKTEKAGGVWRSDWRLPKRDFNKDTFDQMDTGILRGISVGGSLDFATLELLEDDDDPDGMVFGCDWGLLEESLTPIPADVSSGVDRAAAWLARDGAIFDTLITPDGITTADTPALRRHIDNAITAHRRNLELKREETMTTKEFDIPKEILERAVAEGLEKNEQVQALSAEVIALRAELDKEAKTNMDYRAKLDSLQYQPNGAVSQVGNWNPMEDRVLDLGKIMRLTNTADIGLPPLDLTNATYEESVIERAELKTPGRDVVARIPWEALKEHGAQIQAKKQMQLQRTNLTQGAGAIPENVTVLGNAGMILNNWSPILARMDVRFGLSGQVKAPWATTQATAAAGADGADITVTNFVLNDNPVLPVSIATAFEITSSMRAVDDGTFSGIAVTAIRQIIMDEFTGQVLVGGGANEITGIWGTTNVTNIDYGAGNANFDRNDILNLYDTVRLSKSDGGMFTAVLSNGLWKLAERTPRGLAGMVANGLTDIEMYLLEAMPGSPHEGMMEREMAYHYHDLSPTSITNAGLFFAADRVFVPVFGDSLALEYVPTLARKDTYKLVIEANMIMHRPAENAARIKQT